MKATYSLQRVLVAALLVTAVFFQGTLVLANTTGSISGYLTDDAGAAIAGAAVTAKSPSATATVTTDAKGYFNFLSLPPDTYTVSVEATGHTPASIAGVNVLADQTETIALRAPRALKTIAAVRATTGGLVKPGTTADVYSVDTATQQVLQTIAGGYNLNSAYSGIYAQPGVTTAVGAFNYGQGQNFFIRGSSYGQVGYEFDGVPVNRAFDNYNGNTLSDVGQQQLEVYTGGSPSSATSSTLGGYINQVIKTGTYPGFANADIGVGDPTFYHHLQIEAGGSTPDRLFSWYLGFGGYNQQFRQYDNDNGGNFPSDGSGPEGFLGTANLLWAGLTTGHYGNGPFAACPNQNGLLSPPNGFLPTLIGSLWNGGGAIGLNPCDSFGAQSAGYDTSYSDREVVANFHFAIPHKHDGGRDDLQILYDSGSANETWADSVNDLGGISTFNNVFAAFGGAAAGYCFVTQELAAPAGYSSGNCAPGGPTPFPYQDGYIYGPGTKFGQSASSAVVDPYYFPGSSTQRPLYYGLDPNARSSTWNDTGILKIQYQKNFGSNAYARIYGYSFYSDELMNNPEQATLFYALAGYGFDDSFDYPQPDYVLDTHTTGGAFEYANQINARNLLQFTANYVQANVNRFDSTTWLGNGANTDATNLVANGNCYNYATGALDSCFSSTASGTYGAPTQGEAETACATPSLAGTPACAAGASWIVTRPSGTGTLNTVVPKFTSVALNDEWRPNDKLDINAGVRMENYTYDLTNSSDPMDAFWFAQADQVFCYDPKTLQPVLNPISPTAPPPASPVVTPITGQTGGACYSQNPITLAYSPIIAPSGEQAVHPDGQNGHILFTNVSPSAFSSTIFSPRIGGTYTIDPDTVLRFSVGRYTQPTAAAYEQYLDQYGADAATSDFSEFFGLGFYSPAHDNPVQSSNNYDFSLEKRLKGTDISFKISPFYRDTQNQLITLLIGGLGSGVNLGTQHSYGVEFQIQKGDPSHDGWSGALSYTYTQALLQFEDAPNGTNEIDTLNSYISAFNGLTAAGGGAPCYNNTYAVNPSTGTYVVTSSTPSSTCSASSIKNPYYTMKAEPLLNRNGFYPSYIDEPPAGPLQGEDVTAISPNVITGWVQYKHKKLAVAPAFALEEGSSYGAPTDIYGLDPRTCGFNQGSTGAVSTSSPYAGYADYYTCGASLSTSDGYLAVPNPYTGTFDQLGQYREPWHFNLGVQIRYDVTPKITAVLNLANLYNTCFGGSKTPWSDAYPAGQYVCAYDNDYVSLWPGTIPGEGFFYGGSPEDPANGTAGFPGALRFPYQPVASNGAIPFQAYLEFLIKL